MYNFDNFEDEEKEKGIEYLNFKKIIEDNRRDSEACKGEIRGNRHHRWITR